jgi:iron complex transport system ATP-binding protein
MMDSILYTRDLSIGYPKRGGLDHRVLENLELKISRGEVVCALGPNGSGKSTLIRTLSGLQPALSGEAIIQEKIVDYKNPKSIARLLSVVLTDRVDIRNLTVFEMAAMGRYPYTSWFGRSDSLDQERISLALSQVHLEDFAKRRIEELSDGELQRVMIAKALVQDTPIILLDEPTAHLDLPNRMETMQLLRKLAKETNKAILLSTHDLELALQTADLLWLIKKCGPVTVGLPEDLVLNGSFEATFHSDNVRFDAEAGTYRINYHTSKNIQLIGNSITGFWTKRAFEREGYNLDTEINAEVKIIINKLEPKWTVQVGAEIRASFNTLKEIIGYIKNNID